MINDVKHPSHNKGPAETEVRFITDASLAGLAKWLRVLGYDTTVFHQTAGRSMMRCADKENRILLTRRRTWLSGSSPAVFF
jgi:uncharacterized protein with PIN domain